MGSVRCASVGGLAWWYLLLVWFGGDICWVRQRLVFVWWGGTGGGGGKGSFLCVICQLSVLCLVIEVACFICFYVGCGLLVIG